MTSKMSRSGTLLRLAFVPCLAALWAIPACGGSNNSGSSKATGGTGSGTGGSSASGGSSSGGTGGTPFDTGVDGTKNVSDLTPAEVQQICDATEEAVDREFSEARRCRLVGVTTGFQGENPAADCQAAEQQCLEAPEETATECNVPSDCDITVGEYEACINDSLAVYGSVFGSAPECEGLTQDKLLIWALGLAGFQEPASCAIVEEKCPEALPDTGDIPGGGLGGAPGFAGSAGF
jgi:hypothetical protein